MLLNSLKLFIKKMYSLFHCLIFLFIKIKYRKIRQNLSLKDKHHGKTCFILGSAPSILRENILEIKNEIIITMNNFFVHKDFKQLMSGNMPKYHLVAPIHPPQSEEEWVNWLRDMEYKIPSNVNMLLGLSIQKINLEFLVKKYNLFANHKIFYYFGGVTINKGYKFKKKHIEFDKIIWHAATASTYAIIGAIYMGLEKIYLLGVDHNYLFIEDETKFRFYTESLHQNSEHKRMKIKKSDELRATAQVFFEKEIIAENTNCEIYNCSDSSFLDMFKKVSFKSIVSSL